jgi:hypothetical protein
MFSSAVIVNAPVAIYSESNLTDPLENTSTDQSGWYSLIGIPNGTYEVTVIERGCGDSILTVPVSGHDLTLNDSLDCAGTGNGSASGSTFSGFLLWVVVVAVVAAVFVVIVVALLHVRKKGPSETRYGQGPPPPSPYHGQQP